MLGTPVDGAEAARIGLATKVVASEELENAASLLERQLAAGPARAQAVLREGLRRGMGSTLDAEWEHNVYAQLMQVFGGDFGEAVRAFREKRQPKFG